MEQDKIVSYLLEKKLIHAQSIVDGNLLVQNSSRRNFNFKIINKKGPAYIVKIGRELTAFTTIAHEAKVYELLLSSPQNLSLRPYLPCFYAYDPIEGILILEYLRNTEDLQSYHFRRGRFPEFVGSETGRILSLLHRQTFVQQQICDDDPLFFPRIADALHLHRPRPEVFHEISSANINIIKIIQKFEEFSKLLDQLRQEWKPMALIHYDIKWNNFLICKDALQKEKKLKIIDWELAGIGDPCWDIGSIFNDYLSFWLLSIPVTGESAPDQFIELARYPLEKMQSAIRSFWKSYTRLMELDAARSGEWLLRSVRYAAVRLVQSAYEQMQSSIHLTGNVICLLQLSLNMLKRPQEAIVHLLGIPLK